MVLAGFGLAEVDAENHYDFFDNVRRSIQVADDGTLADMAAYLGFTVDTSATSEVSGDDSIWPEKTIRVFLSHSALYKGFVAEVARGLSLYGCHGFVAHDSIEISKEWQGEIEKALRTCDVFVGLVHPEFIGSTWTNQEVGWAYGRGIPYYFVRLGADPPGFPAKTQWPATSASRGVEVAKRIISWLNSLPKYSEQIGGNLIRTLGEAGNYNTAGDAAAALNQFDVLTADQWNALDAAYLENDQVHGSVLAHRGLRPLYARHSRELPRPPS